LMAQKRRRHYYIPKHSIQGFDGDDNLITTMTKKRYPQQILS
jgi:hypothetical protein